MASLCSTSDPCRAWARAAWAGKVDNYKLCLSMERVAAKYRADVQKAGKQPPAATPTPACADPGPFVPLSLRADETALAERLRSEGMRVLLSAMDFACEPPEVLFQAIGNTRGMELITACRACDRQQ